MHIPWPLPGESAHSHRERIVTYNLRSSFESTMDSLRQQTTGVSHWRKRNDCNAVIAPLCSLTEHEYLDRHSLNPIYRLFLKPPTKLWTEQTLFNSSGNDHCSDRKFWCDVILCPECNTTTLEKYGLRYLHRIHYVAGIDVCPRHGTPLLRMSNQQVMSWRTGVEDAIVERLSDALITANMSPALVRYREVCDLLLDLDRVSDREVVVSRVVAELMARQIIKCPKNDWGLAYRFLIEGLPTIWCDRHLRNWLFMKRGFVTVLILCVIFDSVQEIMLVLCDQTAPAKQTLPSFSHSALVSNGNCIGSTVF